MESFGVRAKVKEQISKRNPKENSEDTCSGNHSLCPELLKSLFQTHTLGSLHPDYIQKIVNVTL